MVEKTEQRESVWTVARGWLPVCLVQIFALTIGWTVFVAWVELTEFRHGSIPLAAIAAINKSAPAIPLIVALSIMVVTAADMIRGGIVVTKRFLEEKFLDPWVERRREQDRKRGLEEGRHEERKLWIEWYQRQQRAYAKGEPFDEPPPGSGNSSDTPAFY